VDLPLPKLRFPTFSEWEARVASERPPVLLPIVTLVIPRGIERSRHTGFEGKLFGEGVAIGAAHCIVRKMTRVVSGGCVEKSCPQARAFSRGVVRCPDPVPIRFPLPLFDPGARDMGVRRVRSRFDQPTIPPFLKVYIRVLLP
jgi:hypothetical protein